MSNASALKSEKGELQLPMKPENLLKTIALHCLTEGRDPIDLIQDVHDAACYWLHDHDLRKQTNNTTQFNYSKGLN